MRKIFPITLFFIYICTSLSASTEIPIDRIVAVVDREIITWSELYRSMEFEFSNQIAGLNPEEKKKFFSQYEREYLDRLIDIKIQHKKARELDIDASEKEINVAIDQMRSKFGLSDDKFIEVLKRDGFSLKEYKGKLAEQIIITKLVNIELKSKIIVTEQEINQYIRENNYPSNILEGYKIRQIFFPASSGDVNSTAEKKADEVIRLLEKGESFESIATQYSEGPNAQNGGDLGVIKKDDLARDFISVIEKLKPGQYSKPFWSEKGLNIIYLEENIQPEVARRESVQRILIDEKFKKSLKEWSSSLRNNVSIDVKL